MACQPLDKVSIVVEKNFFEVLVGISVLGSHHELNKKGFYQIGYFCMSVFDLLLNDENFETD